jgi:hypothetical protein
MANKLDYLGLLQVAIQQKHNCMAVHRESVHVHEALDNQTVWKGEVEVFDLTGHAETNKCYAWSHRETRGAGNVRLITVLGKRPVDSALMAVRTAIFYDVQPVPVQNIFKK